MQRELKQKSTPSVRPPWLLTDRPSDVSLNDSNYHVRAIILLAPTGFSISHAP